MLAYAYIGLLIGVLFVVLPPIVPIAVLVCYIGYRTVCRKPKRF